MESRSPQIGDESLEADFARFRQLGDVDAMARVFDAAAPKLLLVAAHLGESASDCEDLVQATFLGALRSRDSWDDGKPLMPWLTSILSHRAIDARRARTTRKTEGLDQPESAPDAARIDPFELSADRERAALVAKAIDGVSEAHREVLVLRIVHGLEPVEIAHALGRSPGTVRAQLARGREQLQQLLPDELRAGAALSPAFVLGALPALDSARASVLTEATHVAGVLQGAAASTMGASQPLFLAAMNTKVALVSVSAVVLALAGWATWQTNGPSVSGANDASRDEVRTDGALDLTDLDEQFARKAARSPSTGSAETGSRDGMATGSLTVSLKTSEGDPVASARVYLRSDRLGVLGRVGRTDPDGRASFQGLEFGSYSVHIDRASKAQRDVRIAGATDVSIILPEGFEVEGRVINLRDEGVAGARILRLDRGHHNGAIEVATSGADGTFRIESLARGSDLVARADGYQPSNPDPRATNRSSRVTLQLGAAGVRVHGRVLRAGDRAVPYAFIVVAVDEDAREEEGGAPFQTRDEKEGKPWDTEVFHIRADEDGQFDTSEIPRASVTLYAFSPEHPNLVAAKSIDVEQADGGPIELLLEPGGEVEGRVTTSDGSPMSGVGVRAEFRGSARLGGLESGYGIAFVNPQTTTAGDGSYKLAGLLPGEQRVEVVPSGDRVAAKTTERLTAGQVLAWSPTIDAADLLRIRVVDHESQPLPGMAVWLTWPGLSGGVSGLDEFVTDEDGRCEIGGLEGRTRVVAIFPPNSDGMFDRVPVHVSEVMASTEEQVIRVDLRAIGSVSGELAPAADGGFSSKEGDRPIVRLIRDGLGDGSGKRVRADGSFQFENVPAGEYVLRFAGGRARYTDETDFAQFSVSRGQDLDLGLLNPEPGTTLVVELIPAEGDRTERIDVQLASAAWRHRWDLRTRRIDDTMRFSTIRSLSAGVYQVSARGPGVASQVWSIPVGRAHALRDPETGALLQVELLELESGREVAIDVRFPPPPTGPDVRQRGADGHGRVDMDLFDSSKRRVDDDRIELPFQGGDARVMRIERRLMPGSYTVTIEDERFDGWDKPKRTVAFQVPAQGAVPPVDVDLTR